MTGAALLRKKLSSEFAHIFPKFYEMCCRRDGVHNRNQNAAASDVASDADQPIASVLVSAGGVVVVGQIEAFDDFFLKSHSHCNFPAHFVVANNAKQNARIGCVGPTSEHSSECREKYACRFPLRVPQRNRAPVSVNEFATLAGMTKLSASNPYKPQVLRLRSGALA